MKEIDCFSLTHTKIPFQSYLVGRETEAGLYVKRQNLLLLMSLSHPMLCLLKAWEHLMSQIQISKLWYSLGKQMYIPVDRISRRQVEVVESQRPCLNILGNF